MEDIKIIGIVTEDIDEPRNDGTLGSALYSIPLKLNRAPSSLWCQLFEAIWKSPPESTLSHRSDIARVAGDRIILDGTTLDELKRTHKRTLELCISEANHREAEMLKKSQEMEDKQREKSEAFRREVEEKASEIDFG